MKAEHWASGDEVRKRALFLKIIFEVYMNTLKWSLWNRLPSRGVPRSISCRVPGIEY